MNDRLCSEQTAVDRHTTLLPKHPRTQDYNEWELGGDNERSNRRIRLRLVHLWPTFCHLNRPATIFFLTPTTFSYSHYNLLNNVKVYMHEGSKRRRGDRAEGWKDLHNRAISLSIWSCVYNLPLLLLNARSNCLSDRPNAPSPSSNLPTI